mmetsp:Transcript_7669/g.47355  ORF Transcript_7669/g.47355 Transcript_7669/m.47355 type:complete len:133 (+) Transcript_7669:655-1053(+)
MQAHSDTRTIDERAHGTDQRGSYREAHADISDSVGCLTHSSVVRVQVGNRIIKKRFHARIEHVQLSRCREEFLKRRASNDLKKAEAKQRGEKIKDALKRQPKGPREGFMVKNVKMETITAIPYDIVKEGIQT